MTVDVVALVTVGGCVGIVVLVVTVVTYVFVGSSFSTASETIKLECLGIRVFLYILQEFSVLNI